MSNGSAPLDADTQQKFEAILAKEPQLQIRLQGDNLKIDVNTTYTIIEADKAKENITVHDEEKKIEHESDAVPANMSSINAIEESKSQQLVLPDYEQEEEEEAKLSSKPHTQYDDPPQRMMSTGSLATHSLMTTGTEVIEEKQNFKDLGAVNKGGFSGQYANPVEDWHKKQVEKALKPKSNYPTFLAHQRNDSFGAQPAPKTTQHQESKIKMHLKSLPA